MSFISNTEAKNSKILTKQILFYILGIIKSFPLPIFIMFLVAILWSIDLSLRPYLLKIILNRVSEGRGTNVFSYLSIPIILYLGMYFLLTSAYRLHGYFVDFRMIPRLREKIANEALSLLIKQDHSFFQNNFSGSLANKVNDLTSSVPMILQIVIDRFFSHTLALAVAIVTLWFVNIRFAISIMIWVILFLMGSLILSKRLTTLADNWSELASRITGQLVDVLSNILSVRLFTGNDLEKKGFGQTVFKAVLAEQKMQWLYFLMWLCYGYSFFILQCVNFYFLCKGRQAGWISVGDFALVLVINISIIEFLWQVAQDFSQFSTYYGRISQALRTILEKPAIQDKPNAPHLKVVDGNISFKKVLFHYKNTKPLFQNLSVTIRAGQKVGLVGYSGSGKTTFVNLILRLYDISNGQVLIDEQDIQEVTQVSLRKHISVIPQEPSLFHRTLKDNIRYGRSGARDEEVINAAKEAHAHEFISKLSMGYDSLVGERGVKISGGQRQRIAIARAILKNAPILILDEATSQLDTLTERYIQVALWKLMESKTTIVVAHRLSTLLHMDRILVFDKGKIIEDGGHSDLLAKRGLYRRLWKSQVAGFLPNTVKCED